MKCTSSLLVGIFLFVPAMLAASAPTAAAQGLGARVAQLEARVEALVAALGEAQEILRFVHVESEPINGLAGPHWIVEGANVHVRSGSGATNDGCAPRVDPRFPNCESLTGLGNVVVGYNEGFPSQARVRTGSHNLIVGMEHRYTSFGGLVAGTGNSVTGAFSSVSGGFDNEASGAGSSVSGGASNEASGSLSSVSGGMFNRASGEDSSVSGGRNRAAPKDFNWAAGRLRERD